MTLPLWTRWAQIPGDPVSGRGGSAQTAPSGSPEAPQAQPERQRPEQDPPRKRRAQPSCIICRNRGVDGRTHWTKDHPRPVRG